MIVKRGNTYVKDHPHCREHALTKDSILPQRLATRRQRRLVGAVDHHPAYQYEQEGGTQEGEIKVAPDRPLDSRG
ncbi:hypothetical protein ES703_90200 [subsurface metagenome]